MDSKNIPYLSLGVTILHLNVTSCDETMQVMIIYHIFFAQGTIIVSTTRSPPTDYTRGLL